MSFGLPPGTEPPDAPQPVASGDWFPHVIRQVRQPDGTVLVSMAMPSLSTFTFRMPLSSWLDGEHMRFVQMPSPLLSVLAIPTASEDGTEDAQDIHGA